MSAQSELIWSTGRGDLRVRSFCTPEEVRACTFNQFGTHAQYKSLFTKRETLEQIAAHPGANLVLVLADDRQIVGFGVLDFPEPNERWAELGPDLMIELKAIEVSRQWRGERIGQGIMQMLMAHPQIEQMIAYLVGYSWTWDLDGTGVTAQQYRAKLIALFAPAGFQEMQTNEPNVCLKPENIFMARVGDAISSQIQQEFKWLRFGISP